MQSRRMLSLMAVLMVVTLALGCEQRTNYIVIYPPPWSEPDGGGGQGGTGGQGGVLDFAECKPPTDVGDVFDPKEVYIPGTLEEGSYYKVAIAHWSSPNVAAVGFNGFDTEYSKIRTMDGRFLYRALPSLREFHCDGCPYSGGTYPSAPLDNDPELPLPCLQFGSDMAWVDEFLVAPTGRVLQSCSNAPYENWYDMDGTVAFSTTNQDWPIHLGYKDLLLTETRVVDLGTGESWLLTDVPNYHIYAARAVEPDKFLVVEAAGFSVEPYEQALAIVDSKGVATKLGDYPPPPPGVKTVEVISSTIDACGRLFQMASTTGDENDVIIRRDIKGGSEIVYNEADNPLVKLIGNWLLTGS
jgi:hypothetical protein